MVCDGVNCELRVMILKMNAIKAASDGNDHVQSKMSLKCNGELPRLL